MPFRLLAVLVAAASVAQAADPKPEVKKKPWYEKLSLRGYTQVRYNDVLPFGDTLANPQGDKSLGTGSVFIRRARLVLSGDVHDRVSVYLQPDFVSTAGEQMHVAILRDWYADVALDADRELRVRLGQSKVPFGFENMQSSSNRLPFDRNDALNSAVKDERDLGAFLYWAPKRIRTRFKELVDGGFKGSGDYGVLALGLYNGQTANQPEANANKHVVARATWPFELGSQLLELSLGGYAGRFVLKKDEDVGGPTEVVDRRAHVSVVLYPKPFGLQAEYNVGLGPEREGDAIVEKVLHGGYATLSYDAGPFMPYVRGTFYDGGKKFEKNAPHYDVRELELGVEWRPVPAFELTAAYLLSDRTVPGRPGTAAGGVGRLQAQLNY